MATLIENAARARIRGVELELAAILTPSLSVSAAYGHLAPRYRDVGPVPDITLDSRFQRTPRHSLTAWVQFEQPVRWGKLELHGDYSFRSREQFQIAAAVNDQEAYGLLDARVTLRTIDDR